MVKQLDREESSHISKNQSWSINGVLTGRDSNESALLHVERRYVRFVLAAYPVTIMALIYPGLLRDFSHRKNLPRDFKHRIDTHMSNISERSKSRPPSRPPFSFSSPLTKRAVVLTAVAAAEATPLPTSVGVDGAKEVTPERKRVMVAMARFIVDWVGARLWLGGMSLKMLPYILGCD
jgi:hypothetical protein